MHNETKVTILSTSMHNETIVTILSKSMHNETIVTILSKSMNSEKIVTIGFCTFSMFESISLCESSLFIVHFLGI